MQNGTLTEADVNALRRSGSKAVRITLLAFALFLFVVGVINLVLCSRFAGLADTTMIEVIRGWFAGVDTSATYSGVYLKAMDRWVTGITELVLAGFLALAWVFARRDAMRNARILKFIEEKGI